MLARLAASPRDHVLFLLRTLVDPGRAFNAAVELGLPFGEFNDDVWDPLIAERARTDPAGVLPVLQQQIESMLVTADAARYRAAAARLRLFRDTATAAGAPDRARALIAGLREQHRRRCRLQAEFDRAGL